MEIILASDAWALLPQAMLAKNRGSLRGVLTSYREPLGLFLIWHEERDPKTMLPLEAAMKTAAESHGWQAVP